MLRSLYSGISGLRSHQAMLDVTGNNIANVNTTAFKASAVQFQDTLSQLTQGAAAPQNQIGGTNPAQVGLGVQVAGISTNFAQGSSQATGRATDLLISGDGFFVTELAGETLFTRAGSFDFDADGRLVSPEGAVVQGWGAQNGVVTAGGATGDIRLPVAAVLGAVPTTAASIIGNLPSDVQTGTIIQREFEVFSAAGDARTVSVLFEKTDAGWDVTGTDDGRTATASLSFTDGVLDDPASLDFPAGVNTAPISVNLSDLEGFADMNTVAFGEQNGNAAGTLESFTLGNDGTLVGVFSNGGLQSIGRIALANFVNPGGLEKAGGSSYRGTFNSGNAVLGTAGLAGLGTISTGSLEMSNVDLSQEFTNLIVAQRGFQANARIITTSDEVLQELTNLKR